MFDFQNSLQAIVQFFHMHPHAASIITFFVVFAEASAVIGVLIPGTITMTAIGMLVGTGVIPAGSTFALAIAGAICGDYLSYLVGHYYKNKLHRIWPFRKNPALLTKSEEFFKKHGGKSVFLGRFIAPMRAMVPMVAGMLKMSQKRFLVAAIPSASIWAVLYIMPGVLLGALSLELPPKKATEFTLIILGVLLGFWLVTWLLHHFAKQIYYIFDTAVMRLWNFLQSHKITRWLPKILEDPREPDNHNQLSLIILTISAFSIFLIIFSSILHHGMLTILNNPLYHFFTSFRTKTIDQLMVITTMFGDEKIALASAFLFLLWLVYKRYWYIAIHWFSLMLCATGFLALMKINVHSPRPNEFSTFQQTSSFPSGHTLLVITQFGFWAVVIARELVKEKRWIPYAVAGVITFFVAFSRIFLGAHWLTDVAASIFAGIGFVLLFTVSYRRQHTIHFSLRQFSLTFLGIYLVVWLAGSSLYFNKYFAEHSLHWPTSTIKFRDWKQQYEGYIPLYRNNRLGKPIQAFNLEWDGDLTTIKHDLTKAGWQEQDAEFDLKSVLGRLLGDSVLRHIPLLPQLYHNKPPALLMTKETGHKDMILILWLWQADITISENGNKPFWLGVVGYHKMRPSLLFNHLNGKKVPFLGATDILMKNLSNNTIKQITYPLNAQPKEMQYLNWDGKVLLLWEKVSIQRQLVTGVGLNSYEK